MKSTRLLLPSLANYESKWLSRDVLAGIVLSALLVPQGMAYAELAGLPAVTGLYTSILCLIGYALVGPSRILVLGPDSSLGPMIAATVLPLMVADGDPTKAVVMASMLAILTGVIMIVSGLGGMGFIADLLSRPTILGYMNGLALTILVGQLPKLLGFSVDAEGFFPEVVGFVQGVVQGEAMPAAAAVGVFSLLLILILTRVMPRLPAVLVAAIAAIMLSVGFDLAGRGVPVVGALVQGLPHFSVPLMELQDIGVLFVGAVGISLVALADTIGTATVFAERQSERVDGNREMIGIGVANVAAGLFQGFPVSTSGSRTAVAERAGARTQVTGLIGAGMIALMLVAFPDLLADLPQATLGAIVIAASLSLADIGGMRRLYRQRRTDFIIGTAAFLGVVLLGVLPGIVVAVALSVAMVFKRIWRPYRATLGQVPGLPGLHDMTNYPDAQTLDGCVVLRFDAPLIFANAGALRDDVHEIADRNPQPLWIVIAAEPITDVDTTACDMLEDLTVELDEQGVRLVFAELKTSPRQKLEQYGLEHVLDSSRFYPTIRAATDDFRSTTGQEWTGQHQRD
ncbi:MAG: sulfate permease [Actinomycetota bacterium]|nr:sulfate permease [Actinomycetota bacterium]